MPSYRSSGSESGANFVQREEDRLRFVPTASPAWSTSYQRVKELYDSNEVINWVSFGPNGAYFVVTTESVYASDTSMMCNKKGKNTPIPPRCASFGYNESWVIVENDGEVRYHGLSTDIEVKLKSSPVQRVALSPHSAASYFIEFTDGNTEFSLPDSWGEHITKIKRTSVQLDMLWVSSDPLKKPNVLFAFGSVKDQFVMITEHKKHSGIDEELRLDSGKYIAALSLGEGGAVFRKIGTSPELLAAPDCE
ncbi:hypothetical protein FRB95_011951 [Tulasnella sp. JGI-2019a]|nr:hypothetical protein FRB95_011951 [Tulasnella sp. JGI-2019a]